MRVCSNCLTRRSPTPPESPSGPTRSATPAFRCPRPLTQACGRRAAGCITIRVRSPRSPFSSTPIFSSGSRTSRVTPQPSLRSARGAPVMAGGTGLAGSGFSGEGFLGEVAQDSFVEGGEGVEFGGGEQVDEMLADVVHVLGGWVLGGAA